jgi:hypothetical protein
MDMALSFAMLVGHSRTCDVSALQLCLLPLELMNGCEIDGRTAALVTCDPDGDTDGASLQHPASIDYLRYGALQICIGLQSLRFSVAVSDWRVGLMGMTCRASKVERFAICNRPSLYTVGLSLPVSST